MKYSWPVPHGDTGMRYVSVLWLNRRAQHDNGVLETVNASCLGHGVIIIGQFDSWECDYILIRSSPNVRAVICSTETHHGRFRSDTPAVKFLPESRDPQFVCPPYSMHSLHFFLIDLRLISFDMHFERNSGGSAPRCLHGRHALIEGNRAGSTDV